MTGLQLRRGDVFGSMFDDFFNDVCVRNGALSKGGETASPVLRARMDVLDKGEAYEVKVDLPGVKKDDIQVTIEGPRVAISAESKSESEAKDRQGRVLRAERSAARYARSFELPVEVDEAGADAKFENGVLTLALPKKAAVVGKRLAIH